MTQVPVVEEGDAISVLIASVDDTVDRATVDASCPAVEEITDIDDVTVLHGGYGDPGIGGWI